MRVGPLSRNARGAIKNVLEFNSLKSPTIGPKIGHFGLKRAIEADIWGPWAELASFRAPWVRIWVRIGKQRKAKCFPEVWTDAGSVTPLRAYTDLARAIPAWIGSHLTGPE
jgi:hypothetical protein